MYICDGLDDDDLGAGGNCDNDEVSSQIKLCLRSLLIAAWAVGGSVRKSCINFSNIKHYFL